MTEALNVVVYVKPGCTLCGPVLETVERVRRDVDFYLEKVDISGDRALMARYGQEVPVLTINGRKAFKGRVPEAQLRRKLKRASEGAEGQSAELESLDALEPEPYVPPRPVALLLVLLTLGVFAWFLSSGFMEAQHGRGKLAGDLLNVERRLTVPVPFTLDSMSGQRVNLEQLRGKVVFLNFWATWCPPCIEEMPSMLRLGERMKSRQDFVMLAVSTDDSWEPVRQFFAAKEQPQFTVLLDAGGKIAKEYGTTMFPETYIIVDGKIVGFIEGPRDWDDWFADEYLNAL